jgi:hypothetical protein
MGFDGMSAYDRTAWDACMKAVYDSRVRRLVPPRVRELTGKAGKVVSAGYEKVPGHEQADWVLEKAFDGGMALTFRPALRSVRPDSVVRRVSSRHPSVENLSDLRGLSLEECDALRRFGLGWTIGSAVEGAASSIAVTGAEVSATVSGGVTASVVFGAIATDVATTMAVMERSIGVVASTYGYDVRQPEEEFFALGVLSLASASTLSGKTAAMASLSRLTQQMMRRATWAQLRRHWLANAIEHSYKALSEWRREFQSGPMRSRTSFRSTRNSKLRSNATRVANRRRPLTSLRWQQFLGIGDTCGWETRQVPRSPHIAGGVYRSA